MSSTPSSRVAFATTASLILAALALLLAAAAPADAANRWVDSNIGLDMSGTNDCADQFNPCETVAQALAKSDAGDVINIDDGV